MANFEPRCGQGRSHLKEAAGIRVLRKHVVSDLLSIKSIPSAGKRIPSMLAELRTDLLRRDALHYQVKNWGSSCTIHRFSSHQRFNTNREQGRDHEVSPARNGSKSFAPRLHRGKSGPNSLQERVLDSRSDVSPQPSFKGQLITAWDDSQSPTVTLHLSSRAEAILVTFPAIFSCRNAEAVFHQGFVEKRNTQLQPVRHTHEIGVSRRVFRI